MIRISIALSMALALCLMTPNADAAEPSDSNVSQSALAAMGLGNLQTVERQESAQIRGQGAVAFGVSWSRTSTQFFGATITGGSINGYYNTFPNFAGGFSFAGSNTVLTPFVYGTGFSLGGGF